MTGPTDGFVSVENDPQWSSASISCCSSEADCSYQSIRLSNYEATIEQWPVILPGPKGDVVTLVRAGAGRPCSPRLLSTPSEASTLAIPAKSARKVWT